jgi:hypothetical protein
VTETGTTQDQSGGAGGGYCPTPGGGHVAPLRAEALRGAPPPPGRAAPLPQVGSPRRNAAPMPRACKNGPGPSSAPGILLPPKITVKGAPCGRVAEAMGASAHP